MKSAAALLALAACAAFGAAPPPPPIASRPAEKGCEWKLFSSAALGLQVPYQRCDFGYRVVVAKHVPHLGLSKSAFTISPDEAYAARVAEEAGTDIPPPPRGTLGVNFNSLTYFEFHALENPRRFAFVSAGQDAPLFDETMIKFLP